MQKHLGLDTFWWAVWPDFRATFSSTLVHCGFLFLQIRCGPAVAHAVRVGVRVRWLGRARKQYAVRY
jgi:hypothetical protein